MEHLKQYIFFNVCFIFQLSIAFIERKKDYDLYFRVFLLAVYV